MHLLEKNKMYPQDTHSSFQEMHLPVMDTLLSKAYEAGKANALNKTAVFYVHHPLKTSVNIVSALIKLGARPNNIFILGKHYSECKTVVSALNKKGVHYQACSMQSSPGTFIYSFIRDINWLWARLVKEIDDTIEEILIMDHGGHAITYLPYELLGKYKIVGIEKTTAGFIDSEQKGLPNIPIIDVANSAAKKYLEAPLIAAAVVNKIVTYLPKDVENFIFGVVGLGAIGQAMVEKLQSMGCKIIVYDINEQQPKLIRDKKNIIFTSKLSALIASSDYIFGCSGRDITEGYLEQFKLAAKDKVLISCSSEDKEFLSLLQMISKSPSLLLDPLENIEFTTLLGANITLLRGGFPVNFDHSGESVPPNDIQLTRSLVLAAVLQAADYFKNQFITGGIYSLESSIQDFIVNEWLKYKDSSEITKEDLAKFKSQV